MIVGRGWGQGPTHSQSFHSMLASIPGLNILYPYSPETAYSDISYGLSSGISLLLSSNIVGFMEVFPLTFLGLFLENSQILF